MRIENLWQEMEAEVEGNSAWLTRFARPQAGYPLLVALENATRSRALLVPMTESDLPPRREWPECLGLKLISVMLGSQLHFGVLLRDPACADVFTTLAENLAPRVAETTGSKKAVGVLLGQLGRWQQFLAANRDELSLEAQRGLWGEIHVLRSHLLPVLGTSVAVIGWKGSAAAHQDFQFSGGAVEVKTTAAKQPQSVRITSERQLDDTGVGRLFLHVVVVDEREVPVSGNAPGQSLASLIADMRSEIAHDFNALRVFDDCLLGRGWLDAHASKYDARRLTVRGERTYEVRSGFPRLVEVDLPIGVGDVNFAISLAACEPFAIPVTVMTSSLIQASGPNTKT